MAVPALPRSHSARIGRRRGRPALGIGRAAAAGAALAVVGLAGCGSTAPATGVTRIDGAVVVAYKPCPESTAGLRRVTLTGSADPDRPVWSATLAADGTAALELPVRPRFPGYEIVDRRRPGGLDPTQTYSFDATATDGSSWGGPDVRPGRLRDGRVRVGGQDLPFEEWIERPASCPRVGLVGAIGTGMVVAAVAGGALLGLRGLIGRLGGRARPDDPDLEPTVR